MLVCKIASKVLNTKGATWKATGSSAESSLAVDPVSGILCISLKLQIRAVVWKRGAHQPGGPPLRTTTAPHLRSSPPGMHWGRLEQGGGGGGLGEPAQVLGE